MIERNADRARWTDASSSPPGTHVFDATDDSLSYGEFATAVGGVRRAGGFS
jgi:hypothetical protein